MNEILKADIEYNCNNHSIPWKELDGTTIFMTGATGLIGMNLVKTIMHFNENCDGTIRLVIFARNEKKAKQLFGQPPYIEYIIGDVSECMEYEGKIDYIIHGASITSSKAFVETPVDILNTAINGTRNMLDLARKHKVKGFLYMSSMEVYGAPTFEERIDETHSANIDTMVVRSCYPESKRVCESLCASYAGQYGVSAVVARLTQTFGPGVEYNDGRVFADFARCVIEKRNIVLHTKGETKRSYLYTGDAVSALLLLLVKGEMGQAYNVANEETFCSIYEMACLVSSECGDGNTEVIIDIEDTAKFGYAPTLLMDLDTSKIQALGWKPTHGLNEMFVNLCQDMQAQIMNN